MKTSDNRRHHSCNQKAQQQAKSTIQEVPECKEMGSVCVCLGADLAQVKSITGSGFEQVSQSAATIQTLQLSW